jgi:diacylglycerol kinase
MLTKPLKQEDSGSFKPVPGFRCRFVLSGAVLTLRNKRFIKYMKLLNSFGFAIQGIKYCVKTQLNFRIHLAAVVLVTGAGFMFAISSAEWLFVTGCFVSVLAAEMFNTAIEKLCDTVLPAINPGIKTVKDVSAGAVLVCAAGSVVVASVIFLPKIFALLQ